MRRSFCVLFLFLTVLVFCAQSNAQVCIQPPNGLTNWWPGDGNATDITGGSDGIIQNHTTFTPGYVGEAFNLDGIDDYVLMGDAPSLNPPNAITMAAWIYLRRYKVFPESNNIIVKDDVNADKRHHVLQVGYWGIGDMPGFSALLTNDIRADAQGGSVSLNTWHHIAGTYDGHVVKVYVDGVLTAFNYLEMPAGVTLVNNDAPLRLGATNHAPYNRFFDGLIDEAQIYNTALSAEEIQAIVAAGREGICKEGVNSPPVAAAGSDQVITQIGSVVQLDGTSSYDLDGDPLTYSWNIISKPEGSLAQLSDPAASMPTFIADVHGSYELSLVVSDGLAESTPDTIMITFMNVPPVASVAGNQSVTVGDAVYLSGSGTDANGDMLTYSWTITSKPPESTATLSYNTATQVWFTADKAGSYVVSLIANDGFVESEPSVITVTAVSAQNAAINFLRTAIELINNFDPSVFRNRNLKHALTNKINAVLSQIDHVQYRGAIEKLENDLIPKVNGCVDSGQTDRNDWLVSCYEQEIIYDSFMNTVTLLYTLL